MTLTDTQSTLLSAASQRDTGSLLPLPEALRPGGGTAKALAALIRNGLAEKRPTDNPAAARRNDNDGDEPVGIFITLAGAAAIGIEPEQLGPQVVGAVDRSGEVGTGRVKPAPASAPASAPAGRPSKSAAVLALLSRDDGATLAELIAATGWLPHTTRAALTGIRRKGHDVTRGKRDGATYYRIEARA